MNTRPSPFLIILIVFLVLPFISGGRLDSLISNPISFLSYLLALLIALTIHEFCHAFTADRLGDPNPRIAGRVSLNPLKHLDPWGTALIIIAGFGWGKPVTFDPYNLKDPVKDGAIIAAAGPVSNFILSGLCVLLIRLNFLPLELATFVFTLFSVNLALGVFNLLPFYPLDGHHLLRALFPPSLRAAYDMFNRHFGIIIALVIIFIPIGGRTIVDYLLTPSLDFAYRLFLGI